MTLEQPKQENLTYPKKIIKSFGYYEDFDLTKLKSAIDTALEYSDEQLSTDILNHVLQQISEKDTVLTSYINDIIEIYLLQHGHNEILKKYIQNRFDKQLAFTKKIKYLGNDLVSSPNFNKAELKDFDVNQIKIAAKRYLLRDMKTGQVNESMSQWFMRVARAVVLGSVAYDPEMNSQKYDFTTNDLSPFLTKPEFGILERIYAKLYNQKKITVSLNRFNINAAYLLSTDKYQSLLKTYFNYMYHGIFEPNTPTLMNAGTTSGKCSACFTLDVEDTMRSIGGTWTSSALIFQGGGGLGVNISKIRPAGANIGTTFGAATGGIALVLEMIDAVTEKVKSGGKRRGANMGIMEYNHPDIDQFIVMKKTPGVLENFNVSVMFDATFWQHYEEENSYPLVFGNNVYGWKETREFMNTIAQSAWASAEPGVLFMDNANKANPLQPLRGDIRITNPCVTANTRLNTEFGMLTMQQLYDYGKPVLVGVDVIHESNVHKGRGKAKKPQPIETKKASEIFKSDDAAEVYRITTVDGYELEATGYHPIILKDGIPITITELIEKMVHETCYVALQSNVGLFGNQGDESVGAILGFAQNNYELIHSLATEKDEKSLYNIICAFDETNDQMTYYTKTNQTMVLSHKQDIKTLLDNMQPNTVPEMIWRGTKDCVKMYLRMIFDTAPPEQCSFEFNILKYINSSRQFLKDLQLLLINFGVKSSITELGTGSYHTYELKVPEQSFAHYLFKIGFRSSKNISKLIYNKYGHTDLKYNSKIVKIEKLEGKHPVYDCTEFDTHKLMFNGMVTGNCSEQYMYDGESCTLGSINLSKFVNNDGIFDWMGYKKAIRDTTRFLNDVLEINVYPTEHIAEESEKSKRIGLGIMGLADLLYKLKIPYNSAQGYELMSKLSETLYIESVKASIDLAEERGSCEWYNRLIENGFTPEDSIKRVYSTDNTIELELDRTNYLGKLNMYGIRNMWTTTVAPTGTISMIAGCSSGLEPIFALVFSKITKAGKYYYTSELFKEALIKEGIYSPELLDRVEKNYGSCRGLDEIPEWMQEVFVTAIDLHWVDHVVAQSVWQNWIDNSISKTINMPHNVTVEDVKNAYVLAHKVGLKGISLYRDGSRHEQVLHVGSNITSSSNELFTTETRQRKKILEPSKFAGEYITAKGANDVLFDVVVNIKEQELPVEEETCKSCGVGKILFREGCNSCSSCGFSSSCIVG